ncbi:MAG TPA: fibronectin type III domain-containing protein [Bacillota bacterium]|nr:fibronectin type III domain-containing protein [Bacillota bacterium]
MKFYRANTYWILILVLFLIIISGAGCGSENSPSKSPSPTPLPPSITLTATNRETAIIHLSCVHNLDYFPIFDIYRRIGANEYEYLTFIFNGATEYTDSSIPHDLNLNEIIYYKFCIRGNAQLESNEASAPFFKPGPPAAPSLLSVLGALAGHCALQWKDSSSNETEFVLQRKDGPAGTYVDITSISSTTIPGKVAEIKYTDSPPNTNTVFSYRVKARNQVGDSGYSNEVTAKTTGDIGVIIE